MKSPAATTPEPWASRFAPTTPDGEMHAQVRDKDGTVRTVNVAQLVAQKDRGSQVFALLGSTGHEFRLMGQTPNLFQIEGLVVAAEFRGEDGKPARQHPFILSAWSDAREADSGSLVYQYGTRTYFVFLLEHAVTDAGIAEAAQRGAEALVVRWLGVADFAPREYRPKRFSEGYAVAPTPFDQWRPGPCSKIGGQRNCTSMRSRDLMFNAIELANAADAQED